MRRPIIKEIIRCVINHLKMGSTFTVFLPNQTDCYGFHQICSGQLQIFPPDQAAEKGDWMTPKDLNDISILFVDNEKLIRNSFARELREEGFKVTAVASGNEAIDMVENEKYDLVITDLSIPDIDGFGVLKAAKKNVPASRVIILTGYADEQSNAKAMFLGADDFILKPCEVHELVFHIHRCLKS